MCYEYFISELFLCLAQPTDDFTRSVVAEKLLFIFLYHGGVDTFNQDSTHDTIYRNKYTCKHFVGGVCYYNACVMNILFRNYSCFDNLSSIFLTCLYYIMQCLWTNVKPIFTKYFRQNTNSSYKMFTCILVPIYCIMVLFILVYLMFITWILHSSPTTSTIDGIAVCTWYKTSGAYIVQDFRCVHGTILIVSCVLSWLNVSTPPWYRNMKSSFSATTDLVKSSVGCARLHEDTNNDSCMIWVVFRISLTLWLYK
jgi:hypothetical protein